MRGCGGHLRPCGHFEARCSEVVREGSGGVIRGFCDQSNHCSRSADSVGLSFVITAGNCVPPCSGTRPTRRNARNRLPSNPAAPKKVTLKNEVTRPPTEGARARVAELNAKVSEEGKVQEILQQNLMAISNPSKAPVCSGRTRPESA